jgi:hypothetical protein
MPSADFCLLTQDVAIQGAAGFLMRCCLFRGSLKDSYPPTANGHAGFLVIRVNPFRILLMSLLPHGKQISPDKDVLARQSATARRRELSVHPATAGPHLPCPLNLRARLAESKRALLCCANLPTGRQACPGAEPSAFALGATAGQVYSRFLADPA